MKHFLDTSVARSLLTGTAAYKSYLNSELGNERRYVTSFVPMEVRRSFLDAAINFYFTLEMPSILNVDDALKLWSDNFKGSRLKAVLQLIGGLMKAHGSTRAAAPTRRRRSPRSLHISSGSTVSCGGRLPTREKTRLGVHVLLSRWTSIQKIRGAVCASFAKSSTP